MSKKGIGKMSPITKENNNFHFQNKEYKDSPYPSPKQLKIQKIYKHVKKMEPITEEFPAGWPNVHFGD